MVHQHFRLVTPFTVAENVVLGDHRDVGRTFLLRRVRSSAASRGCRQRYGLAVDPRARIWQLSLGEQQRVEILKALYQDARILILDEPTAVLTPQESEALFGTIRAMADDGRTVIFISHKLHEVKAVADRVTILRRGRSVATVAAAEATPRSLAALMVGREIELGRRKAHRTVGEACLELDGLWGARRPRLARCSGRLAQRPAWRDRRGRRRRGERPARARRDDRRNACADRRLDLRCGPQAEGR